MPALSRVCSPEHSMLIGAAGLQEKVSRGVRESWATRRWEGGQEGTKGYPGNDRQITPSFLLQMVNQMG